jgi:hypothetical protein
MARANKSQNRLKKKNKKVQQPRKVPLSRQNYTADALSAAVDAVANQNMGVREASSIYGVPRATISDHVNGKSKSNILGRGPILDHDVELLMVHALTKLRMKSDYLKPFLMISNVLIRLFIIFLYLQFAIKFLVFVKIHHIIAN